MREDDPAHWIIQIITKNMNIRNIECKAKVDDLTFCEKRLLLLNPEYKGLDMQVDTYFNVREGRLKLREGNIENALIHYDREDCTGAKESRIILYKYIPDQALKDILVKHLGVKVIVRKRRKIYNIDNVKFHFDEVERLGSFIEIEAIGEADNPDSGRISRQCQFYMEYFNFLPENYLNKSYSDMVMDLHKNFE
ncbi:MAG: class IV adenylate cyclase [Saprospiraceae bacterium]|nr:class IV adenylate cyclase [Saprospiraceae bacterium]